MMRHEPQAEHAGSSNAGGTGVWWGFVASLIAAAAILALILQNGQHVTFEWLWFDFDASLGATVLLTALVTLIAASLVGLWWRHRRRGDGGRSPGHHRFGIFGKAERTDHPVAS